LLVAALLYRSSTFDSSCWMRTGPQERVSIQAGFAQVTTCFEVLLACVGHGYPAEADEPATQRSFFCKTIIAAARKRVCALVDSFAVCVRGKLFGSGPRFGEVVPAQLSLARGVAVNQNKSQHAQIFAAWLAVFPVGFALFAEGAEAFLRIFKAVEFVEEDVHGIAEAVA
jgi:hypothetical protein